MMPDLQTTWASLLLRSFADAGVTNLVISPGSRSTPFVLAALREPRLRCTDAIDERTAAFFALGQAKATGRPTLLLCTSGSAGTHYFPAVIEAAYSHTPLLILTADRPFELHGSGAPQTIDQTRLFGMHARGFVDLGSAEGSELALRALRRQVAQAVALATWPLPGAVHLNARASKPLEPRAAASELDREAATSAQELSNAAFPRIHLPKELPSPEGVSRLAASIRRARRGLIFCGPAPVYRYAAQRPWLALAARLGFPLLAEGPSQLRFLKGTKLPEGLVLCDGFGAFLGAEALVATSPDLILQIGGTPTSSAWEKYLGVHRGCERWIIAPRGWNDPLSNASESLVCEPGEAAAALLGQLEQAGEVDTKWTELFAAANRAAWGSIDAALASASPSAPTGSLSEPAAVRAAVQSVPEGGILAVGNSLPVREVDAFCRWDSAACRVWSQRGANGIDGLVSGAAGVGSTGEAVTLLLGDVSLLHDLGGLALTRYAGRLTVIVLQNRGGRIFEELPIASSPEFGAAAAHFTTPHALELGPAAALYGLAYRRVESLTDLEHALAPESPRPLLIEAIVPPRSVLEIQAAAAARFADFMGAPMRAQVRLT
jgi:2-succinyl-5-enolpyruvyl-6-hydroxy-3-cyclohexene-1-carboxylate synthase